MAATKLAQDKAGGIVSVVYRGRTGPGRLIAGMCLRPSRFRNSRLRGWKQRQPFRSKCRSSGRAGRTDGAYVS